MPVIDSCLNMSYLSTITRNRSTTTTMKINYTAPELCSVTMLMDSQILEDSPSNWDNYDGLMGDGNNDWRNLGEY